MTDMVCTWKKMRKNVLHLSGPAQRHFTKCEQKQIVRGSIFKCDRDSRGEEKSQRFHALAEHAYEIEVAYLHTLQKQAPI